MIATWPRAHPAAGACAVMKAAPEHFRVTELPGARPAGDGEHLFLKLRKTGLTTVAVAEWLATAFGVPTVAVGYAGMKDKRAVTEQWFSVHTPAAAAALPARPEVTLLESARHRRKLRRGDLAGNRFELRLTDVRGDAWESRLAEVREHGVPNYFGAQRFGRDNVEQASAWLGQQRRRRLGAFRRGLYLSVLRSFLFNEVLGARVRAGLWDSWLPGDVPVTLPGSGAGTAPSGPLWGRGRSPAAERAAAIEAEALAPHRALCDGLEHAGPTQERRSLVLRADDLTWQRDADQVLLTFSLPAGCYATALLGEVFELSEPVALAS